MSRNGKGRAGGRRHSEFDRDDAARRAGESERGFAERDARAGSDRDMTPAVGRPGEPGRWERAEPEGTVALHVGRWKDGRWSYLYKEDTAYAEGGPAAAERGRAARGARDAEPPRVVGPMIHAPVWTWEVPVYFWFGGIAAGSSFVALACDLAGDERSATIARRVSLGAVMPSPVLLIMDLGRPARFLNMMRIFKPRSPMSMGAWCLIAFSGTQTTAVGLDLLGRRREAKALGAVSAVLGGYLGSYTGVLLAATAVPLWARSRGLLGPIFVATATATGAAATRLALVATGLPPGPSRDALGTVETTAMATELALSTLNEKRLGDLASGLDRGRPGKLFKTAKWLVRTGLALRLVRGRFGRPAHDGASVMYLVAGLLFRIAWVEAGKLNAADDEVVAKMAREQR